MVKVFYALLSQNPLKDGFDDIRAATMWIDGPVALLESTDSLSVRRGVRGDVMLRKIDMNESDYSAQYAAAVLFRFDLENIESAALAWEILLAVLSEGYSYDVWNAAYPARTIAKCAELRPLKLLNTDGYVMQPAEFHCLAERAPTRE